MFLIVQSRNCSIRLGKICLNTLVLFQQYYEMRKRGIAALRENNEEPYPHKFHVSISLSDFIEKYNGLEIGQHLNDVSVSVAGRLFYEWLIIANIDAFIYMH